MIACLIRPTWVVSWDGNYITMQPFYQFLERARKATQPAPYSGTVRVYRLSFSEAVGAFDRSIRSAEVPCL